jgi:hypothetical protein
VSFPCLTNILNVPDPVFKLVISTRTLSFEPLAKAPKVSAPELFIIIPCEIVSKVKDVILVPPPNDDVVEPDIIKNEFPVNPLEVVEVNTKFEALTLELINCKDEVYKAIELLKLNIAEEENT